MTDVHDEKTRSFNMSRIRAKNTGPELVVRKFLFSRGFRYRIHDEKLPGKPDIVLRKYRTVILVHGCFWHGHEGCKYFVIPKTRTAWWKAKIAKTKDRDEKNQLELAKRDFNVVSIFECQLRTDMIEKTFTHLLNHLSRK